MTQEDFQKKYFEFQVLNEKLAHLQEQHSALESHLNDLTLLISSLGSVENLKKENEILIPLSNTIFAKAEMKETKNFIVGVGANVLVEKSKEELFSTTEIQRKELSSILLKLEEEIKKIASRAHSLQSELLEQ